MRTYRFLFLVLELVLAVLLGSARAQADNPSPSPAAIQEAKNRFDQGIQLFNEGNNAGALSEFQRAYQVTGNQLVLFNIALVYAALGRPVEAVDALDKVLADPVDLSAEDVKRAVTLRSEQLRRVASVVVKTDVRGAVVEVDDVQAGKTPLDAPLRVAVGTHRVAVLAPGFYPFRTEITVAGGEARTIPAKLLPTESKTSKLNVTSHVLDAEVLIDGKLEGRTPLPAELVLPPGTHRVALRRAGYLTAEAGVTLVEGSTRQLQLDPQPDPAAVASRSEKIRLVTNPQDAVAVVDNLPQPGSSGALTLLPGRHTIRVERNGFMPIERVVTVRAGQSTTLRATLAPTPDTREEFERGARARRTWGLVTAGAGAVVGAAGGVFLYLNGKDIDDKQGLYDEMVYESEAHSGRSCDPFEPGTVFAECNAQLDTRYQSLQDAKALTKFGWIGVGVGAAALVTGLVLVITGDDPGHYDDVEPGFSRSLQTWLPRVAFTDRDAWILFDHAL